MANGYCPALLRSIESIAGENAPSKKLHVAGFLAALFCCQNSSVSPINDGYEDWHQRTLTVSYSQRPVVSQVQDEDDCDINRLPVISEWDLGQMRRKSHSFYISDDLMSRYCADEAETIRTGAPATPLMRRHYDEVLASANVVMKAINTDLVTLAVTQFGENAVTGSSAVRTLNIAPTPTVDLNAGILRLLQDIEYNEICGEPCIVGDGNIVAFQMAQQIACCNSAGMNFANLSTPRVFRDKDTQTVWGANQFAVLAPGSVKFISRNLYTGSQAGTKGGSTFFTLRLPVNEFGCAPECLDDLVFDVQMRYFDCPETVTINGSATTLPRGWQFIISKSYNLWVQPTNAYAAGDPLADTNGFLRYALTNA